MAIQNRHRQPAFAFSFAMKVLVPSLAAAGAIAALLLYIVNGIFEESNRLDLSYSKRSAYSALASIQENLETIVYDNAYWDDAAAQTYAANPRTWLDNMWGDGTTLGVYDAVFITDGLGYGYYATVHGERKTLKPDEYFEPGIHQLLERLPDDGRTFGKISGFLRTGNTISVVAAGVILPSTEGLGIGTARPRILVFSKTIGGDLLESLGRRFVLDDLGMRRNGETGTAAIDVTSPSGEKIAMLTWAMRSPGDVIRSKFLNVVAMVLLLFMFVVGVLVYMSWRGFKEAHRNREEALQSALRDDLTGLANRRALISILSDMLESQERKGTALSLVYADLDGFKEVNDAHGHDVGDQLLRAVAAGFTALADGNCVAARLGGDEFALIVTSPDSANRARRLARDMIAFLAAPIAFDGRSASVSVSVGIVDVLSSGMGVDETIRRADVAMYAAKAAGRNRYCIYEPALDSRRNEHRAIARQLKSHIENGKIALVFQPIVDARTRTVRGVEALARWPAEDEHSYPPAVFVPVAEEFGLIEELGAFVLREACRQAARWPGIFVSVNISPLHFLKPGFVESVESIVAQSGLRPNQLEIEVTESLIMGNAERAEATIGKLHGMRVGVSLDDFGTGYSSIGHLKRFRFDKLKLDRSMVADILRSPSALRLIQGAVTMADSLGLTVVAEGVDDESQVAVLKLAGCGQFQGFLFSEPVDGKLIPALIEKGPLRAAG